MVVYPVMGQPSCYPTTQATPPPLNIASSAVSIFKRWMNQTANNIYCKAMLAQCHICQTSYFIMKDFLQTPPHTSPSDRPLWKPSALWPASQHNSHTVFGAPRRPLGGGGVSSPATQFQLKPLLCGGETSATAQEPPLRLRHKSPAPLWLSHKGLHSGS